MQGRDRRLEEIRDSKIRKATRISNGPKYFLLSSTKNVNEDTVLGTIPVCSRSKSNTLFNKTYKQFFVPVRDRRFRTDSSVFVVC